MKKVLRVDVIEPANGESIQIVGYTGGSGEGTVTSVNTVEPVNGDVTLTDLIFLTPLYDQDLVVTEGTATINMSRNEVYYNTYTIEDSITITITGIGSATITITADGSSTPVITGATKDPRSDDWDIVNSHRNRFIFWNDEEDIWYSITKLD